MESILSSVGTEVALGLGLGSAVFATVAAAAVYTSQRRATKRSHDHIEQSAQNKVLRSPNEKNVVSPQRKKQRVFGQPTSPSHPLRSSETVVSILQRHAQSSHRHRIAYTFLDDHGKELVNYSFAEVDAAARRIAATLQSTTPPTRHGDRVILCYPPGLDFALGFWGCLYAGAIGIPVYPPYPGTLAKDLPKFNRMVEDSQAKIILTNRTYYVATQLATAKSFFSTNSSTSWPKEVQWITTDCIAESMTALYQDMSPILGMNDVAFFQYSSGSTSAPKAVMISYGNVAAQLQTWQSIQSTDVLISWLPSYHDMGLVGFILSPIVFLARCISMSPISFIKDPSVWMRVVTHYKATHICGPNFSFALAARKTSDQQAQQMDLSTLKQTICAAEPIRAESLTVFTSKFRRGGFDPSTFNCGYGLAEVTLVVTGQDPLIRQEPVILRVDKRRLESEKRVVVAPPGQGDPTTVMTLVGCGKPKPTFTLLIVDPETHIPLKTGQVGEIWVSGPSVATGYWHRPELTAQSFQAQVAGSKPTDPYYLKTGDMGFIDPTSQQVFLTGRLKDLIIIRGRNVCPQDVEASVESAHEAVRPGCVAAFSIEKGAEEVLVVVAEVKNGSDPSTTHEICRAIRSTVLKEHQLRCEGIVLLPLKTIPKTTSGKIQRSNAKAKYLTRTFSKPIYEWTVSGKEEKEEEVVVEKKPEASTSTDGVVLDGSTTSTKTEEEILAWLMDRLAQVVNDTHEEGETAVNWSKEGEPKPVSTPSKPKPVSMDPTTPWAEYGLDSVAIVGLSSELGEYVGCVIPPSVFFQYDTPAKLATAPGFSTGEWVLPGSDPNQTQTQTHLYTSLDSIPSSTFAIAEFPEVVHLHTQMQSFEQVGLRVPYLETLTPETRTMTNFNTYNYLGHASHPIVLQAAKQAIDTLGTTMSSSPIVGQHHIAVELEAALCSFFQAQDAVLFVGGWVSNVTTIDALVGAGDLILCDALNHDSCVTGQRLSGATILPFPHNDTNALERMLVSLRTKYRRVLVVIEGVYSMDGDIPDLKQFVVLKQRYKCLLFVDEAHSFGTMGLTGRGLCEHTGVNPEDVDMRMGTMSKALGSVGGFILGSTPLVQYLKHCAGGFVFSVGLSPAHSGAALQSLQLMTKDASSTTTLQARSCYFYDRCLHHEIPMGPTTYRGAPVVVVIIGSTLTTAFASQYLAIHGRVNVKPIVYPAVEEGKGRLRFFISKLHTEKELEHAILILKEYLKNPQKATEEMMKEKKKELTNGHGEEKKKQKQKKKKKEMIEENWQKASTGDKLVPVVHTKPINKRKSTSNGREAK